MKWLCGSTSPPGYVVTTAPIGPATTSNEPLYLDNIIGNYSLVLQYENRTYPVNFSPGAEQIVNVTVTISSGLVDVVGCSFGSSTCFNETNPLNVTIIQNTTSTATQISGNVQSGVNASNACAMSMAYNSDPNNNSAFGILLGSIQSSPKFNALEGNESGYVYQGGSCGATIGLGISFSYTDRQHPFTVCGNSSTWPEYYINTKIDLTPTGYDLTNSNFTSVYYGPTNTTVSCTVELTTK